MYSNIIFGMFKKKKRTIEASPEEFTDRELNVHSLHMFNEINQFFDAYNKEILKMILNKRDQGNFERLWNNVVSTMANLDKHLEKEN